MISIKVKAGALQLTLFIAIVIALLLFSFILFINTQKKFSKQSDLIVKTVELADNGITYGLLNELPLKDSTVVDQLEEYKNLIVHRDFWGVFERISSVATIKNNTFKKVSLIGGIQDIKDNRACLYLKDSNNPLIVVGNTHVEGIANLPKQGVKSGNIDGHSYYGTQLVYGSTKYSASFPNLSNELLNHLKSVDRGNYDNKSLIELNGNSSLKNSFLADQKVIYSVTPIVLSNSSLTGKIIIQSKAKITVENNTKLNDVLLIAPEIQIKDFVRGNFQAIATKNITIGKKVELEYPSALALMDSNDASSPEANTVPLEDHSIVIDEDSTVKGIVLYYDDSEANNFNAQVNIGLNTRIFGEVYCNKNLELNGSVYGTVYTNNFITKKSGSIYQNHLYNAEININKLSEFYVGLPLSINEKNVAKWLY